MIKTISIEFMNNGDNCDINDATFCDIMINDDIIYECYFKRGYGANISAVVDDVFMGFANAEFKPSVEGVEFLIKEQLESLDVEFDCAIE